MRYYKITAATTGDEVMAVMTESITGQWVRREDYERLQAIIEDVQRWMQAKSREYDATRATR